MKTTLYPNFLNAKARFALKFHADHELLTTIAILFLIKSLFL